MDKREIYLVECLTTDDRVGIKKEVFYDLVNYGFETYNEVHLHIYKDGRVVLHEIYIVKVQSVHLHDVAHNEYELEA